MEVVVSGCIFVAVAVATYQVLPYPKQRVLELEQRADIVRYMDKKLVDYKDAITLNATRITYCSDTGLCNRDVCGVEYCTNYSCPSPGDPGLNEIVSNHKTMCDIQVTVDASATCAPENNDSTDAKQVCLIAKWPKKQRVGAKNYETLTAFVFKP